ncbi:MAG TPA: hypothetical protein VMY76_04720 [Gemmatimonadales bacterium]|nr:hypothetical protein [Gemmatimonadales bacterium]
MLAMQEMVEGFMAAPRWAQAGMLFFALCFVVMIGEPMVKKRRFRRQFNAITRELGVEAPPGLAWPVNVSTTNGGRRFEVRHDYLTRSRGSSYRGPSGYLLMTATRLAGERWPMHQVDISKVEGRLARLLRGVRATGDPAFDSRLMVVEDGLPVRDGWLDAPTRAAISTFFERARLPGILSVREGELLFTIQDPWTGADGPAVRTLLEGQAELATAFEGRG